MSEYENRLAVGVFCDVCGTRIMDDRGELHACPWGPHPDDESEVPC